MAKHDPNGPKTLDMFPAMERLPRYREPRTVFVPCPRCGARRTIDRREWSATQQLRLRKMERWNSASQIRKKWTEVDPGSGPNTPIHCYSCSSTPVAADWHRAYEREQLAARGVPTPRSSQGQEAS